MQKYIKHEKIGIYYLADKLKVADKESIDFLYQESIDLKKEVVRLCLHNDESSQLMSMMILVRDHFIYPAHRHIWKDECYTVIKGSMKYNDLNKNGEILNSKIVKEGDTILNIEKGFHNIIPLSKVLCFIETTIGPFTNRPIEFLNI